MNRRFSAELLRQIRNQIPVLVLIRDRLQWPCKISEGIFRFLCPLCCDFHTATNPRTNLARCFRCRRNFNPIDLLMVADQCSFLQAVTRLRPLLPQAGACPLPQPSVPSGQPLPGGV